ncbi:peroxisomal membrane protein PMP34 isoform X6 [Ambystoma mexicanum]
MTVFYPLDTARLRLQVDEKRKSKSTPKVLMEIMKEEGIFAPYRGWFSVISSLCCSNFVYFYTFNSLKIAWVNREHSSTGKDLILGFVADPGSGWCNCGTKWTPFGQLDDLLLPATNVTSVPVIKGILIVMNNVVPKQPYASADKPARPKTWIREMRQTHQEQMKTTLMPAVQETFVGSRKHSPMITQEENMWIYLAQQVLNISHFCLTDVPNAEALLTTCLGAVPTPVPVLKHIFGVTHDSLVQDSDIGQSFSVYEYCRFCQETDKKWRNLTRVITYNITQGDVCLYYDVQSTRNW